MPTRGRSDCSKRLSHSSRPPSRLPALHRHAAGSPVDRSDHIALLDAIDDVHVFREHRRKDGVAAVEPRVVDEVDVELRVAGVAAADRQTHEPRTLLAAEMSILSRRNSFAPEYSLAPGLPP